MVSKEAGLRLDARLCIAVSITLRETIFLVSRSQLLSRTHLGRRTPAVGQAHGRLEAWSDADRNPWDLWLLVGRP